MKPNIGLSEKDMKATCKILNTLLADEFQLYARTRNAHWNVTGQGFAELHKFFEDQYGELAEMLDSVAERVRKLGGIADGELANVLKNTRLEDVKTESSAMKMIGNLLNDHETIIRAVRENIPTVDETYKDAGTADFLTGIMEAHEKMAWMLRAHLS